jgi:hypothetical protein
MMSEVQLDLNFVWGLWLPSNSSSGLGCFTFERGDIVSFIPLYNFRPQLRLRRLMEVWRDPEYECYSYSQILIPSKKIYFSLIDFFYKFLISHKINTKYSNVKQKTFPIFLPRRP